MGSIYRRVGPELTTAASVCLNRDSEGKRVLSSCVGCSCSGRIDAFPACYLPVSLAANASEEQTAGQDGGHSETGAGEE